MIGTNHLYKREADDLKKIEIWWLKKHQFLDQPTGEITWNERFWDNQFKVQVTVLNSGENKSLRIEYILNARDGTKTEISRKVELTTTNCHFRGKRDWFLCPTVGCGKRVGILYKSGDYFACRHCHNLTYRSRNEKRSLRDDLTLIGLDSLIEAEKLQQTITRSFYAGQQTKKQRKLEHLYQRYSQAIQTL